MYCHYCGKKISSSSIFCKHCGQLQKKQLVKNVKKSEYIWTCEYCKKEFPTKSLSDAHEQICASNPKNNKLPNVSNPKKFWTIVWLVTLAVFGTTLFISVMFAEQKIYLLSGGFLLGFFLVNIGIGVVAFLAMAVSNNKSKNNETSMLLKNILIMCFLYLLISPIVFATEGYRAANNEDYKKRLYSGNFPSTPSPTPTPRYSALKLIELINEYRSNQKLAKLETDFEVCQVAQRFADQGKTNSTINYSDFSDLCSQCTNITYNSLNIPNSSDSEILTFWKNEAGTGKNLLGKFKYGCAAFKDGKPVFVFSNKAVKQTTAPNTVSSNSGTIECIGPDGKQFNTTMEACKSLNEKWGKPVDYIVDCGISLTCGGGSRKLKLSECNNTTCCQVGSNWIFYLSKDKCKADQGSGSGSNNNPPQAVATSTQNTSPKVTFQATETSIKGTYYCYENKVNSMVTQQSYVKILRESYELCNNSTYNQSKYSDCCSTKSCSTLSGAERDTCYTECYNLGYGTCNDYRKTYSTEQSKLDNMRWTNCP